MVRTRADNTGRRVVGAKAPRKQLGGASSSTSVFGSPGSKDKYSSGNPVRWTPTPSWQKGIGTFFGKLETYQGNPSTGDDKSTATHSVSSALQEYSSNINEEIPLPEN